MPELRLLDELLLAAVSINVAVHAVAVFCFLKNHLVDSNYCRPM